MPVSLTIIGTFAILVFPWTILSAGVFREKVLPDRIAIGIVSGTAATITLGYLLATAGKLDLYAYVYLPAALFSGGLAIRFWKARRQPRKGKQRPSSQWRPGRIRKDRMGLLIGLFAILIAEAIPVFSTEWPVGWDAAFHSILSRKILNTNSLAEDWSPFEDIEVNYSQGMHVLIAIISRWSGQAVHRTFLVLHLVVQSLAAVFIYLLSMRIFENSRIAVLAMLSYAFLCNWGSFTSYYQWGGLPTEIGSLLFLAIVWTLMASTDKMHLALGVLFFGSLILVHHMSALIATSVMGFYIAMHGLDRKLDDLSWAFLKLFALTLVAYAFFIVPYALKSTSLGNTEVLKFSEEKLMPLRGILSALGYTAAGLGLIGLFLSSRQTEHPAQRFLLCWFTALLSAFCLLSYVYRFAAIYFFYEDFTAFTPSRFLTVLSYPLAIYAGYALHELWSAGTNRLGKWQAQWKTPHSSDTVFAVLVALILISAVPDVKHLVALRAFPPGLCEIAAQVKKKTPRNSFIIYVNPEGNIEWLPYLTWRPTVYTPIPASENRRAVFEKRRMFRGLVDLVEVNAWLNEKGLQGFQGTRNPDGTFTLSKIAK